MIAVAHFPSNEELLKAEQKFMFNKCNLDVVKMEREKKTERVFS